jgi:hypothetical protein
LISDPCHSSRNLPEFLFILKLTPLIDQYFSQLASSSVHERSLNDRHRREAFEAMIIVRFVMELLLPINNIF